MDAVVMVLEFYSDHPAPFPSLIRPPRSSSIASPLRVALLFTLAIGGCAQMATGPDGPAPARPTAPPIAPQQEPPPPAVNLSGFPLPYRQGYADGCGSATGPERKDTTRFAADGNYRTGWQDGLALCRKK
jgi:hypothetical protein